MLLMLLKLHELNEGTIMEQLKQEVCTIRILFPAISDEQAIDVKKKIQAMLSEIPETHIQFGLTTGLPANPPKS